VAHIELEFISLKKKAIEEKSSTPKNAGMVDVG
jgi:hypothetical protein